MVLRLVLVFFDIPSNQIGIACVVKSGAVSLNLLPGRQVIPFNPTDHGDHDSNCDDSNHVVFPQGQGIDGPKHAAAGNSECRTSSLELGAKLFLFRSSPNSVHSLTPAPLVLFHFGKSKCGNYITLSKTIPMNS